VGESVTERLKSLAWQLADAHGIHVRQLAIVLRREYGALLRDANNGAQKAADFAAALPYKDLEDMIRATKREYPEAFE
jgi:hypothetical protein